MAITVRQFLVLVALLLLQLVYSEARLQATRRQQQSTQQGARPARLASTHSHAGETGPTATAYEALDDFSCTHHTRSDPNLRAGISQDAACTRICGSMAQ